MQSLYSKSPTPRPQPARARARLASMTSTLSLYLGLALCLPLATQAQPVGTVAPLNGNYTQQVSDLSVQASVGEVSWMRVFNGSGWRFNRQWDGINASFTSALTQSTGL
jgi:hypothetical protein